MNTQPINGCPQPESPIGTIVNPPLAHTAADTILPALQAITRGTALEGLYGEAPMNAVTRNMRKGITDGLQASYRRTETDLSWTAPEVVDALQWCLTELHESHCVCREFHSALRVLRRMGGEL